MTPFLFSVPSHLCFTLMIVLLLFCFALCYVYCLPALTRLMYFSEWIKNTLIPCEQNKTIFSVSINWSDVVHVTYLSDRRIFSQTLRLYTCAIIKSICQRFVSLLHCNCIIYIYIYINNIYTSKYPTTQWHLAYCKVRMR